MRKTLATAARILCVALAVAAHIASGQTPETPGAPPIAPGAPPVESPAAVPPARAPSGAAVSVPPRKGGGGVHFPGAGPHARGEGEFQMTGGHKLIHPPRRGAG